MSADVEDTACRDTASLMEMLMRTTVCSHVWVNKLDIDRRVGVLFCSNCKTDINMRTLYYHAYAEAVRDAYLYARLEDEHNVHPPSTAIEFQWFDGYFYIRLPRLPEHVSVEAAKMKQLFQNRLIEMYESVPSVNSTDEESITRVLKQLLKQEMIVASKMLLEDFVFDEETNGEHR